ncbi:hypothetical protein [Streptomyces siamensis]|uniref:hypothetical protein n=1 Tax=Streptomyces siamensis TaxID=1274986 RepID=UPI0031E9A7AF
MNPNNMVATASITSLTFTPREAAGVAISLTMEMLTNRKMFSISLAQLGDLGLGYPHCRQQDAVVETFDHIQ